MPRRIENVFNRHDTWANTLKPGQFYFDRELKTVYSATVSGVALGTAAVIGASDTLIEGVAEGSWCSGAFSSFQKNQLVAFDSAKGQIEKAWCGGVRTPDPGIAL